jgi:hypothetical protein
MSSGILSAWAAMPEETDKIKAAHYDREIPNPLDAVAAPAIPEPKSLPTGV